MPRLLPAKVATAQKVRPEEKPCQKVPCAGRARGLLYKSVGFTIKTALEDGDCIFIFTVQMRSPETTAVESGSSPAGRQPPQLSVPPAGYSENF